MLARLALALALVACSPSAAEPEQAAPAKCDPSLPAPSSVPALEVLREGSIGGWAPLAAGDVLSRHYGAQGGSHFYVYGRLFADSPSPWLLSATLTSPGSAALAQGSRGFTACAGQWVEPREITVFIEASGDLAGMLEVMAKPEQGPPLTFAAPISVGGG